MKASVAAGAAGLLLATCAAAQSPLPEVVVTATRFSENPQNLPVNVTVVTRQDIERSSASTIPQLLSQYAGIHVRDNTGGPDWQVDLRGFGITGDQNTLVLIDGQRMSDIDLSSARWSSIPIDAIERIEIMRGSGSVMYGGGATGGTINIITRSAPRNDRSATLHAEGGSYATSDLRVAGNVSGADAGLAFNGSDYYSDNYRDNNRLRQRDADLDLRYGDNARNFGVKLSVYEQDLRNPGVRTAAQLDSDRRGATTPNDYSVGRGGRINLGTDIDLGGNSLAVNLTWRDKQAKGIQEFGGASTLIDTEVKVWSFNPRLKVPYDLGPLRSSLVVGIDLENWDYDSAFNGGFFLSHALSGQRNSAVYVQNHAQYGDTRVTLGARAQRSENTITELLPAASTVDQSLGLSAWELALRHQFVPGLAVFGKVGTSFRVATVDENRFQLTLLQPQKSDDLEVGAEWQGSALRLRASIFQMRLTNEIYFSPLFPPFGANVNLSPTERDGLELSSSYAFGERFDLFANYAYTSAKFRSGTYGGVDVTDKDVPLVPKNVLSVGGSWRIAERTRLNGIVRWVSNQRFDNDQANTFPGRIPDYAPVDLKLTHEAGGWRFAATVRNLFNQRYFSYGIVNLAGTSFNAYPAAERNFLASAEYRFR
ncbi:MAG TPA: TonB-dependent receptor [Burkholderiales bacterium]|nr:TonB-dependent receptor [Burkholderiales bacterium]